MLKQQSNRSRDYRRDHKDGRYCPNHGTRCDAVAGALFIDGDLKISGRIADVPEIKKFLTGGA